MKIIQDCKFNEISRRSQLYVHLLCPGQCRIVHRPNRSGGDECCRGRRLFVGKYPAERSSILPSGASGKFHANRYIELTGLDQTAEGFGPGEWNLPRYGALAWKVQLWSSNCPRYRHQPWKVQLLNPEPSVICVFIADGCFVYIELSTIWGISMEGALLRHGPSVISSLRVEGWFCLHRTVRDSGLKRGGFGSGEWNLPRFRASARMVPLWMLNLP